MNSTIEISMDKQGRIVIPSKIRRNLGLKRGTTLVVETNKRGDACLRVKPKKLKAARLPKAQDILVNEGGILVVTSQPTEDLTNFIQREREARIQKFIKQAGL
jgi:AbrB family looped-hinge helix DNA binding protein